jgi:hypothetical protein
LPIDVGEDAVVADVDGGQGGALAAMAAELPSEPDVVTVVGRLDQRGDWSLVEAVWPIAVPPGSQGRLAVSGAGAPELGLAARLAGELTATVIAPRADVLLVPGGSIFAADGWLRYDASGSSGPAGRRTPRPDWESDVDGRLESERSDTAGPPCASSTPSHPDDNCKGTAWPRGRVSPARAALG